MFDLIIIGAGVNGCFIAREASKYNMKILVIEKENDVGNLTSAANSAIIHSGYDPITNSLKAKLNVLGNSLYTDICKDLDVEFERIGSLTIATTDDEISVLESLKERALRNKVDVEILDRDDVISREPNITKNVKKALYAASAGIINPFELCVALMENAMENGVILKLNTEVRNIIKNEDYYTIETNKESYKTKFVVNAAGINADKISNIINEDKIYLQPRKGEYYVLDQLNHVLVNHVIFSVPSKMGKGVLVTRTTSDNYLLGPSSSVIDDKEDLSTNKDVLNSVLENAKRLVDNIPTNKIIRQFAGLRAHHESDDFIINENNYFINVLGIASPGLASSPAIALMVIDLILNKYKYDLNKNFNPKRKPLYRINKLSAEERNELIKEDSKFGNIICRCCEVSEAEIVDSIKRKCGATSIKGVKKRVRPGAGRCQGGFCEAHVLKILARELNIDQKDVLYDKVGSNILLRETKEGANYE